MYKESWGVLTGVVLLCITVFLLLSVSTAVIMSHHPLIVLILALVWIGTVSSVMTEVRHVWKSWEIKPYVSTDAYDFLGVFCGGMITFLIQRYVGVNAVIASSAVGLVGGILFKPQGAAIYCGSFVGMASPALFAYFPSMMLGAFFASIIFVLTKESFQGDGGKLGTIAFVGSLLSAGVFRYIPLSDPVPSWDIGAVLMLYAVLGAFITYVLSHRLKFGPVAASAAVGLAAGLVLPLVHGQETGLLFAVMVFCASFSGMADKTRIPKATGMIPAGIICAILFIYSAPFFGGTGGKLGTIAFASVLSIDGWSRLGKARIN